MKTIEQASVEYSKEQYDHDPIMRFQCETHFEAGIEFAQQFINIEDEEPEYYDPVIIELQNGGVIAWRGWSEIYGDTYTINGTDIYLMAKEVKRWRPINFK